MKVKALFSSWVQLSGINVVVLFCSIATGVVVARSVDVATLGLFTIIQGVVRLLDGTVGLQAYQTLIKLGTNAVGSGSKREFEGLVKASLLVETASQLLACAIALATIAFFGQLLGLTSDATLWGMVYACGMILHTTGSSLAVLRIFDKFLLGSLGDIVGSVLRLSSTIVCALVGAHPFTFLLGWLAAEVISNLTTIALAWRELYKRSFGGFLRSNAIRVIRQHRDFWPTIVAANVTSTLRLTTEHGDVVLVGAVFGATAAGYLRIAKAISAAVVQLAWPINFLLGPTLTRYWASGDFDNMFRLVLTTIAASFCIFIVAVVGFLFFGSTLIGLFYGPSYVPATQVATIYMFAFALTIIGSAISPAIYAMGKPMHYTYIHVVCVIAFTVSVYVLLPYLGIAATGVGHAVYQTLWLFIGYTIVFVGIRRAKRSRELL
jgi:O-antigen/teichoic acid export membrane protein